MISARTKAALAAARARGVKLGGQRGSPERMRHVAQKGKRAASAVIRRTAVAKRNEDLSAGDRGIIRGAGHTTPQQIADGLECAGYYSSPRRCLVSRADTSDSRAFDTTSGA